MSLRASLAVLPLAAACASPAPPPPPPPRAPAPPAASSTPTPSAAQGRERVSVTTVAAPPALAVDGDLGEWGSLEPPPVSKQPAAASHVALAILEDRVLLAADLRGDAGEGVWLGVRSESVELPPIGGFDPMSGVVPLDCEREATPACREAVKAREALAAKKEARFVRVLRVDREGVRVRLPDGALVAPAPRSNVEPIVRVRASTGGLLVEAVLPASVLPSFDLPLVDAIDLAAAPLAAGGKLADDAYTTLALPAHVAFAPHADIRQKAWELFVGPPRRLAYDPGSDDVTVYAYPGELRDLQYADTLRLTESVARLYTRKRAFGDLEIGALLDDAGVAVLRGGKVLDAREVTPMGMVERDGELHVLAAVVAGVSDGTRSIGYPSYAVRPDGTIRESIVPEGGQGFLSLEPFYAPERGSFGHSGTRKESPNRLETTTYTYDARSRAYVAKTISGPAPKKPKPNTKPNTNPRPNPRPKAKR